MTPTEPLSTLRKKVPVDARGFAAVFAIYITQALKLSEEEHGDLIELADAFRKAKTHKERAEIVETMEEVLVRPPLKLTGKPLDGPEMESAGLTKWMKAVAARIRKHRLEAGLTQEELASKAGLPQSHISRLENAQHSPTQMTLRKIAGALGVPLKEFDPSAE